MLAAGQTAVPGRVGREGLGAARTQAVSCEGGTQHQAEQHSVLTSILSFGAFLQHEKKQYQTAVRAPLSKGQLWAESPGGRGELAGREGTVKPGVRRP